MEVPGLTQDEFFHHLELQSVRTIRVKCHYRQALKERLRSSSKSLLPETDSRNPVRSLAQCHVQPQLQWDTGHASRRIFSSRSVVVRAQSSSVQARLGRPAIETPSVAAVPNPPAWAHLLNDPKYPIPKVRQEIRQRLDHTPTPPDSHIQVRLAEPSLEPHSVPRSYSCRIRPQPPTPRAKENIVVVPPEFAGELTRRESGQNCTPLKNHAILKPWLSVNALLTLARGPSNSATAPSLKGPDRAARRGFIPVRPRPIRSLEALLAREKCQSPFTHARELDRHPPPCLKHCRFCRTRLSYKRSPTPCRECLLRHQPRQIRPMILAQKQSKGGSNLPQCDIGRQICLKRATMIKQVVAQHASEMHQVDLAKFVAEHRGPSRRWDI